MNCRPNKPEMLIHQLTPANVRYTGDGDFWRTLPNGKHSNPDFIVEPIKKTRKVIFHHGLFWHKDELKDRGQELIQLWDEIGYECLIIWEDKLEATPDLIASFIGQETWQLQLPVAVGT